MSSQRILGKHRIATIGRPRPAIARPGNRRLSRKWWWRVGAIGAVLLLAVAGFGVFQIHASRVRQAETDARIRARFAQLQADPLLGVLAARFGNYRLGPMLLRCHEDSLDGSLPPYQEYDFHPHLGPKLRQQFVAAVKSAGWKVEPSPGPGVHTDLDLSMTKSFGTWKSETQAWLNGKVLALEVKTASGDRCS